ncbi:MAG: hypothetical protein JST92_26770 [Deltaproteobacteria bacterium]|nr:hypothetical protein [Deltaproteobacteria bacterium]
MTHRIFAVVTLTCALACGGSLGLEGGLDAGTDAGTDAGSDAGTLTLEQRTQAVQTTISDNSACTAVPNFYWEIGDKDGALASGEVGVGVHSDTQMGIASASKLLWGAYVVERFKDSMASIDDNLMTMRGGYVSLNYSSCLTTTTVADCQSKGTNGDHTAADDGVFHYDGGHFQKYAVGLGLGADTNATLAAHMKEKLGSDLGFSFNSPQLAGGAKTSAADYALFLRKILNQQLAIGSHLGENAVCTLPGTCPRADYSPVNENWHYSYGHWVEDDPATDDGAFSSPGAFGFYPWIDASKTYYGVLARYSLEGQAYVQSVLCGRLLRKAFVTGVAQ